MKVRATALGYDGERRYREGQVFELKDPKKFSATWMEKVDADDSESDAPQSKAPEKAKKGKGSSTVVI